jgi:Spy/CpxP family protein refolding chaperone
VTKHRWMILALLLSVAFNMTFLCALGFRLWEKRKHRTEWRAGAEHAERAPGNSMEPGGPGAPGGGPGFEDELNLGPEQRGRLKHLRDSFFSQIHASHERIFEKRKALAELIASAKLDTAAIGRTLEEIGRMQIEIEQKVVRQMLRERELMNPKQREQFNRIIIGRFGVKDRNEFLRRFHREEPDNRPKPQSPK